MNRCSKRGWLTKREAKRELRSCRESPHEWRRECRTYRCNRCGLYHLTSQPHHKFDATEEVAA